MAYLTKQSQKIIDVTDPSDWTDTRLPVLKSVDSALRCQICKDYYHTPVMTNCCHTFCSECIRRSLVREQKCPVCRATAQESQLRKNGAAQEFVDAFGEARGLLMEMATTKEESVTNRKKGFIRNRVEDSMGEEDDEEEEVEDDVDSFMGMGGPKKRKRGGNMDSGSALDSFMNVASGRKRRATRGSSRLGSQTSSQPSSQNQIVPLDDDDKDDTYKPPSSSGLVACPICNQYMKVPRVDTHIESGCPKESPAASPLKQRRGAFDSSWFGPASQSSTSTSTPNTTTAPPELLPKITFNVMKEPALRRKFREIGIPSDGSRKVLQDRYNEWLTIWNANVDSITPKSKKELLRELSAWEVTNRAPVVEKTKASGWSDKGWSEANKSQFDELIKQAKSQGRVVVKKEMNVKKDEKEDEDGEEEGEEEGGEESASTIENAQTDGAFDEEYLLRNTTTTIVINDDYDDDGDEEEEEVLQNNTTVTITPSALPQPQYFAAATGSAGSNNQQFTTSQMTYPLPSPSSTPTYQTQQPSTYLPYADFPPAPATTDPTLPLSLPMSMMTMTREEDTSLIGAYGKRKYEEMEIGRGTSTN